MLSLLIPNYLFAMSHLLPLDSSTGEKVLQVLHDRVQESGTTLLLVTHDMKVARSCSHIFTMESGVLYDYAA